MFALLLIIAGCTKPGEGKEEEQEDCVKNNYGTVYFTFSPAGYRYTVMYEVTSSPTPIAPKWKVVPNGILEDTLQLAPRVYQMYVYQIDNSGDTISTIPAGVIVGQRCVIDTVEIDFI